MKVKALVSCQFEIEYEDQNDDMDYTKENIFMSDISDLLELKTEETIELVNVLSIKRI